MAAIIGRKTSPSLSGRVAWPACAVQWQRRNQAAKPASDPAAASAGSWEALSPMSSVRSFLRKAKSGGPGSKGTQAVGDAERARSQARPKRLTGQQIR